MKNILAKMVVAALAVLTPIHSVLIATGVIIFIDLITGIWRAVKNKEAIRSSALRRTLTKLLVYNLAIISGFLLETYLLSGVPATKLISSVVGLVEAKSILENLNDIYGTDLFKALLKTLGSDNDKLLSQVTNSNVTEKQADKESDNK